MKRPAAPESLRSLRSFAVKQNNIGKIPFGGRRHARGHQRREQEFQSLSSRAFGIDDIAYSTLDTTGPEKHLHRPVFSSKPPISWSNGRSNIYITTLLSKGYEQLCHQAVHERNLNFFRHGKEAESRDDAKMDILGQHIIPRGNICRTPRREKIAR